MSAYSWNSVCCCFYVVIHVVWFHFYFYKVLEVKPADVPSKKLPVTKPQKEVEMAPTRGMLGRPSTLSLYYPFMYLDYLSCFLLSVFFSCLTEPMQYNKIYLNALCNRQYNNSKVVCLRYISNVNYSIDLNISLTCLNIGFV